MLTKGRWNRGLGWITLLPRGDRKLQVEEVIDIQAISDERARGLITSTYNYFSILEGLSMSVVSKRHRTLYIERGLIYIEIEDRPLFLRMSSTHMHLPIGTKWIGLEIRTRKEGGLFDPTIAAPLVGAIGADREVIEARYVLNNSDSYPIGMIDESINIYPFNGIEISRPSTYTYNKTPYLFRQLIEQGFEEELGSFISKGLGVKEIAGRLWVDTGRAYINGRLVVKNYTTYLDIPLDGKYHLLLSQEGCVFLQGEEDVDIQERLIYNSQLLPITTEEGQLLISNESIGTYTSVMRIGPYMELATVEKLGGLVTINNSLNRYISAKELDRLELLTQKEAYSLIDIDKELQREATLSGREATLSGLYGDSLHNLNGSDVNHPLFNSSYIEGKGMGLSSSSSSLLYDLGRSEGMSLIEREGRIRYLTPIGNNKPYLSQLNKENHIQVPKGVGVIGEVYPTALYLEPTHKKYSTKDSTQVPIRRTRLYVELRGLTQGTSYHLLINGVRVNSFIYPSSLIPDKEGSLDIAFDTPQLMPSSSYLLELVQGVTRVWCYSLPLIEEQRGLYPIPDQAVPVSSIYQSFQVSQSLSISDIGIAIKSLRGVELLDNSLLIARLEVFRLDGENPGTLLTAKDIYKGDIQLGKLSNINLTYPINLRSGSYGIGLYAYKNGVEILTSNNSTYTEGALYVKEGTNWVKHINKDITFYITQFIPEGATSLLEIGMKSIEAFSDIHYTLPSYLEGNMDVVVEENKEGAWQQLTKGALESNRNLRIKLDGMGVIDIGSSCWIGTNYNKLSTWISTEKNFYRTYTNLELLLNYKKEIRSSLKIYLSSDSSKSWNLLTQTEERLLDANQHIYQTKWKISDLPSYVEYLDPHQNITYKERTLMVIRIDMEGGQGEMYVEGLKVVVY
jgi:hypothetical protein